MTRSNSAIRIAILVIMALLVALLWDELMDLGAELYRFFN